jgi:hypothetical protein
MTPGSPSLAGDGMRDGRYEAAGPGAEPTDVISADPRRVALRPGWGLAVVLLVAALAAAVVLTLHYRDQATAAHRQLQSVTGPAPAGIASLLLSTSTAMLPGAPPLSGEVTAFVVRSSSGVARVVVTARITGGGPGVRYVLLGGDCAGDAPVHDWAAGVTDAHGSAQLTGRPWTVSVSHRYFLALSSPGSDHPGPAVHGYFGRVRGLTPVQGGIAPCVP